MRPWSCFLQDQLIQTTEIHIVPPLSNPVRLSDYGVGIFGSVPTKSAWKKAIKKQWVTVEEVMGTTGTFLRGGERIRLVIPEAAPPKKQLILPLRVLWEDAHLALVHKPAGIVVSGNRWKTIANALPQNIEPSSLPDATRSQPIHRLDYPTTGLLLVGKTSSSIRALNQLFAEQQVEKTYLAVTIGKMEGQGTIATDIDGKPAKSTYVVQASVPSERFGQLNLVRLLPHTGRTHQLRIHLASIGHPILGDRDYGREPLILKGKGMYLHAYALRFVHPFSGKALLVADELPEKFGKIFPGE
ncbi:MAG: RluA family pseudouridine synthase [Bacteroidota bacterium]